MPIRRDACDGGVQDRCAESRRAAGTVCWMWQTAFYLRGEVVKGGKSSCRFALRSGEMWGMPEKGHVRIGRT